MIKNNRTSESCMLLWNLFWTDTNISSLFCLPKLQNIHFQLCRIKTLIFPNCRGMSNSSVFGELLGHTKKSLVSLKQKRLSTGLWWRGSFQAVTVFKQISIFKKEKNPNRWQYNRLNYTQINQLHQIPICFNAHAMSSCDQQLLWKSKAFLAK